ncbi:DEAD/DEAH box helicase [Crenobacter intestini]|uniref:DEAD/DEAH box helicase n=1 Tax=Crenobacter intestini TaxID=2563443 RepID=A0A4T0UPW3_9NEIS|nr:DEAD/DEAH box helicase [Crenobacter intestini]TIC80596.1 DEAD/DEAH box helicase [Crenobacter intestini]
MPFSIPAQPAGAACLFALCLIARAATHAEVLAFGRRLDPLLDEEAVEAALAELSRDACVAPADGGRWVVAPDALAPAWRALLDGYAGERLRDALFAFWQLERSRAPRFASEAAALSVIRLLLWQGTNQARLTAWRDACGGSILWSRVLERAGLGVVDADLFARLAPEWAAALGRRALERLLAGDAAMRPLLVTVEDRLAAGEGDARLASLLAQAWLFAGEHDRLAEMLARPPLAGSADVPALGAALAFARGDFSAAAAGFDVAQRDAALPEALAWLQPLALMAAGDATSCAAALALCGRHGRSHGEDSRWGIIATALKARAGRLDADAAGLPLQGTPHHADADDLLRLMMRAWLGPREGRPSLQPADAPALAALHDRLAGCGFGWLQAQYDAALARLMGEPGTPAFFAAVRAQGWREQLDELSALFSAGPVRNRLRWRLDVGDDGAVRAIEPWQQRFGARGWGTARPVALATLAADATLADADARVARAIRPGPGRGWQLDLTLALPALVGHPGVEWADAPGVAVELALRAPQLIVSRTEAGWTLQVDPPLRAAALSGSPEREQDALAALTVRRESASRAVLVWLDEAQQRAARLLGALPAIPPAGAEPLSATLSVLASHFTVVGELPARGAAPTEAAARQLRAELMFDGETLELRLVAAPAGVDGPRLVPGHGGAMLALRDGEVRRTLRRDLAAERAALAAIVDACGLERRGASKPQAWTIRGCDAALALIERLSALPSAPLLDWPRGRAVRIDAVAAPALRVRGQGGQDWLSLEGELELDEERVLALIDLLEKLRRHGSRFIELDEGRYLALTDSLRDALVQLALLSEPAAGGVRVPAAAVGCLSGLGDAALEVDAALGERLARLQRPADTACEPPAGLCAQLRDYQTTGYRWMMRLAQSGLGACLADDMGLGKTLQSIAVLLARAEGGAALVVAPTSLLGNWAQEIARFAPALRVASYGDAADRAGLLAGAGAGDVLLVSYTLFADASGAFAARGWHTLVVDEAQAIKNPQSARSRAVYAQDAAFRLVLSGTPVENRLMELWAIMHACNPGLLGSEEQFARRFAQPIEREGRADALDALRALIAPFVLRRCKEEVLTELPPRTELLLPVRASREEAQWYEALRRKALADAEESAASDASGKARMNVLAQLTRLRRAACDPRLVQPDIRLAGAKVIAFAELAGALVEGGHKVLVFSQFVDFIGLLREPLDRAGIRCLQLDGSTPVAERNRLVAAFQRGEGDVFLISLKAGGFGLNLTAADYVVIADPWWNPAAEDQASARAHRMGQQRPVTVYRLVNEGSLEPRILRMHEDKRALADAVLSGAQPLSPPTADEMLALMRG